MLLRVILATLALALASVPAVSAEDDPPQCIIECDCPLGTIGCFAKRAVEEAKALADELDPRNWPCTCDPGDEPW